jgi:hypothetical protein
VPKIVDLPAVWRQRAHRSDFHYNRTHPLKEYPALRFQNAHQSSNSDIGRKTDDNFRTMIEVAIGTKADTHRRQLGLA